MEEVVTLGRIELKFLVLIILPNLEETLVYNEGTSVGVTEWSIDDTIEGAIIIPIESLMERSSLGIS